MRTLDNWIELLKDRSKDGDIGEYFGRKDCAELLKLLEELRLYRGASKSVLEEMELRNKTEEHIAVQMVQKEKLLEIIPEPYKCPDCIEFPCGRIECDKNTLAKECKYFELW